MIFAKLRLSGSAYVGVSLMATGSFWTGRPPKAETAKMHCRGCRMVIMRGGCVFVCHFKVHNPMIWSIFTRKYIHHHYLVSDTIQRPKKKHYTSQFTLYLISWQLLIYFLCVRICLFWIFHINGTMQCEVLCVWLLSFSIMFWRFTHAVVSVSVSVLFFIPFYVLFHGTDIPH